uniref:Retrotransposon gag domain-containing protein n=1 Tax=Cannabis sativa TaxID=3483 RepID=A0A803Q2C7_CANSA
MAGPITLDPRVIQERAKVWIEDATQMEDPTSPTEYSSGSKEESQSAMEEERVPARGTRVRKIGFTRLTNSLICTGFSNDTRFSMVPFHLDGTPYTWFQWMEKGGRFPEWESFLRALRLLIEVSIYDDPLGRITKITQTGRVSTFNAKFEGLMTQILGVSEQFFINYFVWGLKNEIRRELVLSKQVDLADAMAKA